MTTKITKTEYKRIVEIIGLLKRFRGMTTEDKDRLINEFEKAITTPCPVCKRPYIENDNNRNNKHNS